MSNFDEKQWLDDAKDYIRHKIKPYEAPPCIFSISKALLEECKDAYVPQIVSIGPCHFGKEHLTGMERFKSDAVRREVLRIQFATDNSDFKFEQVIERIKSRGEEIKRCYDKGTQFNGEVLHWMVARDACFILEFFRNHLSGVQEDDYDGDDDDMSFKNDFEFPPKLHPIFGKKSENPGVKSEIKKDLIKLDNQIPLFVLEDILAMEMSDSPDRANAKLDKLLRTMFDKIYHRPFEFCGKTKSERRNHILDIYHHSCLGAVTAENEEETGNELKLNVCCPCFTGSNGVQCSCFERPLQQSEKLRKHIERKRSKPPSTAVGGSCENVKASKQRKEWWLKIPSAVELKNGGVKFLTNAREVTDIRYEGKTLTLVPLKLDVDSEVYIRNLIALEICSPDYKHKRMTAYCQFMYELCRTDKGVDVMRQKGVIIGNLWYSKRVTQLLSVSNLTISQPACKSIKETREKLSNCYKTRRSILLRSLWTEFWNAYGSKPWLVVGGFGATLVLCLTAIQVFCLFKHCGA
ncbi:hypothetical protein SUGI_0570600 [Cryptomeria japonica]|uniref:putative UPF0481 protein At3g02645 n=1 Tax=Cryptomeria japonica TaxID=3369 RepID=UPI002408DE4C|nr:putative UPF0481 protein At3g02645 [Cryptomeria japonica]GLJ28930.1 hypothetical protein SUGI_0570600 [Cryptomeria japonica]